MRYSVGSFVSGITQKAKRLWKWILPLEGEIARKIAYLSVIFSLLIFSYSIIKPLKDTIFLSFVGPLYQPIAKLALMILTPAFMLLYSAILCRSHRQHAAMLFPSLYAIGCLLFAALLLHPAIGIANTVTSPSRILGWIVYTTFDLYPIAVVATFWALTSSISTPKHSALQYGIMTAVSRVAGMAASALGHFLLKGSFDVERTIPLLLAIGAVSLALTAPVIYLMFSRLNKETLRGYTDTHTSHTPKKAPGLLEGLKKMIQEPYAFGIFGLVCGYELVSTLINFRMQCLVATQTAFCVKKIGSFIFGYTFVFQSIGCLIALFGTTTLPKRLGMRTSLLITPCLLLLFSTTLLFGTNLFLLTSMMVGMRALNYGFNIPVREMLFIPTSRNIQFLTKGWITSFGKTFSKASGSLLNLATTSGVCWIRPAFSSYISVIVCTCWAAIGLLVGNRFQKAIAQDEVIGDKKAS